jgi:hypothetical protein
MAAHELLLFCAHVQQMVWQWWSDSFIVFSIPVTYSKKFHRENGVMWQNFQNSKSYWMMYDCVEEEKEIQIIVMSQKMNTVKKVKRVCPISVWSVIRE